MLLTSDSDESREDVGGGTVSEELTERERELTGTCGIRSSRRTFFFLVGFGVDVTGPSLWLNTLPSGLLWHLLVVSVLCLIVDNDSMESSLNCSKFFNFKQQGRHTDMVFGDGTFSPVSVLIRPMMFSFWHFSPVRP